VAFAGESGGLAHQVCELQVSRDHAEFFIAPCNLVLA
jgi:hypothetical protein